MGILDPPAIPPRTGPANVLLDGDSYFAGTGLTDTDDGIGPRLREMWQMGAGRMVNLSVSGSPIRTTYYRVWQQVGVKRTAAPYSAQLACFVGKWWTNDAIRGTTAAQEYGVKAAMKGVIAKLQSGSVYDYSDSTVTQGDSGWTALLWANLASEPYDVDPQSPSAPWGGGLGCWRSSTPGSTKTITVPSDHTGAVDLFFIGGPYGGVVSIAVDGTPHGTLTTSGCGATTFVTSKADERCGLVYRITGLTANATHSIVMTVTSVQAGTANNPGEIRFDGWSIKAPVSPIIMFPDCPEIPDVPYGGPTGLWDSVTPAVCTTYTTWINAVADEANGAAGLGYPVKVIAVQSLNTHATAPGPAGHPNIDGAAAWAATIARAYSRTSWAKEAAAYRASWQTECLLETATLDDILPAAGNVTPATDGNRSLGIVSLRWSDVHSWKFTTIAGTAAAPSVTTSGDTASGIYFGGSQVNVSVAGAQLVGLTAAGLTMFSGHIVLNTDSAVDIGTASKRLRAVYSLSLSLAAGSVGAPSIATQGATTTGIYFPTGEVAATVAGTKVIGIAAAGITVSQDVLAATANTRSVGATGTRFANVWATLVTGSGLAMDAVDGTGVLTAGGQTTAPSAPAAGKATLFAKPTAGSDLLYQQGPVGVASPIGHPPWGKTWKLITPQSTTGVRTNGYGAVSIIGAGTESTPITAAYGLVGNNLTATSANAIADVLVTIPEFTRGTVGDGYGGILAKSRASFPDASYNESGASTGARLWPLAMIPSGGASGLFGADRGGTQSLCGFVRAHVNGGASDSTWQFVTCNATSATTTDTTMTFTIAHIYDFTIRLPLGSATIYWQVDDVTAGTTQTGSSASNLPLAATLLEPVCGISTINATGRNIQWNYVYVESDVG